MTYTNRNIGAKVAILGLILTLASVPWIRGFAETVKISAFVAFGTLIVAGIAIGMIELSKQYRQLYMLDPHVVADLYSDPFMPVPDGYEAEEMESVHHQLDELGVPRGLNGKPLSLWGRIALMTDVEKEVVRTRMVSGPSHAIGEVALDFFLNNRPVGPAVNITTEVDVYNFNPEVKDAAGDMVQVQKLYGAVKCYPIVPTRDELYHALRDTCNAFRTELDDLLVRSTQAGVNITVENVPATGEDGEPILRIGSIAKKASIRPSFQYMRAYMSEYFRLKADREQKANDCSIVCQAGKVDGVGCPHDSCDREDGIR